MIFIDNASSEYLFIVEFFAKDDKPAIDVAREVFAEIFDPTIKMGLAATKHYIESSYDAVGILLCIRLNMQFALELQRRRVPNYTCHFSRARQYWSNLFLPRNPIYFLPEILSC